MSKETRTDILANFLMSMAEECNLGGVPLAGAVVQRASARLRDFAELITFVTGRDADEYLRDAKTTGYPPLTSQSDVRTTVLGDTATTKEDPQ